ncbi:MAG: hypothetical protein IT581_22695 [Verrucomicrobiales bacterium]|nr:hypothetical protein [Verrucomicrobiales bacterium]
MRSRLIQILAAFTLICAISGPWNLLQCFAWTGMAMSFAKESSIGEALTKTFDGKHPCRLCKLVAEGKKSSKATESPSTDRKLDPCVRFESVSFQLARPEAMPVSYRGQRCLRHEVPPVPPPRFA